MSVIEVLEALGLLGFAISTVVGATGRYPLQTVGVAGTFVVAAALLALVAVGTLRARSWSRTPGIVWQVVQAFVGIYALQGQGGQLFAVAAILPAIVAIVLLFTRPVREATARSTGRA
ncbi:hypothetical protein [Amnibacterium kyonggiense]|uniref:Uncharacterized protein n=1 Tax=Amnibacterium kyonggiense TaxID=595671 RepID=A0A4R7FHI8_9MICO|nr:hypothetical protein [Amnibacterium kyonggiense]TDS74489.1 hypothetical protein CLV52_3672 [Amnibacterium kyonggiense]